MILRRIVILTFILMIFGNLASLLWSMFHVGWAELPPVIAAFHLVKLLYGLLFFVLFFLIEKLIWNFLPSRVKNLYDSDKKLYRGILFICYLVFFIVVWGLNHFVLDYRLNLFSLASNLGIILFFLFLALNWLKPERLKSFVLVLSGLFSISALLLSFVSLSRSQPKTSTEILRSLPYASWVPAEKTLSKKGVVIHDKTRAFEGLNLYVSRNFGSVYLVVMSGQVIHSWTPELNNINDYEWHHAELSPDGDLVEIAKRELLIRMDWDSKIRWIQRTPAHHDLDFSENNDIFTLGHNYEILFRSLIPLPLANNYLTIVSSEGKVKKNISFLDILKKDIPEERFQKMIRWLFSPKDFGLRWGRLLITPEEIFDRITEIDLFHINTIDIIDRNIDSVFRKGNVLFCSRYLDLVGVIDIQKERLLWKWGEDDLDGPHHPVLLENGHLLIFDNGSRRRYSRVIELDTITEKIVWQYTGSPPQTFFSNWGGANQRLPNGNTLITESDKGRVFEITPDGEVVWEFYNPELNEREKKRAPIYRMTRIIGRQKDTILKRIEKKTQGNLS